MNREFLKGLGLEEEAIENIMAEHGKTVNKAKVDLTNAQTERDDLKTQLTERDSQLETLKVKAAGNEGLLEEINTLKEANMNTAKEYQEKLDKQAYDFALERALIDAKAKNPKAVKALLNTEAVKLDGDKLLGLEEQLKALLESDGYLFAEEQENTPPGITIQGAKPAEGSAKGHEGAPNPWSKETFNLTEQGRILRENPELAKQFQVTKQ